MNQPCKECPFRKGAAQWKAGFGLEGPEAKVYALKEVDEQKIFSCHKRHPDHNIFSFRRMQKNDCAGYRLMLENMKMPNKNHEVVNEFNETGPIDFDLRQWARGHYFSNNLKLI